MLLVSTGFKVALLGPNSFASIFEGGEIRIFAGTRPSSANAAEPSLPIAVVSRTGQSDSGLSFLQVGDFMIKPPSDNWLLTALQPGQLAWFRLVGKNDDGGASLTEPRIDGDIGTAAAPNDLTLSVTSMPAGTALPLDSFLYTIPPLDGH